MKAGDPLVYNKGLPVWRAVLNYICDFSDIATWGVGSWIKSGWKRPLPDVLVLDKATLNEFRGLPFLYEWRVTALDLASLGSAAAYKRAIARIAAVGGDLLLSVGINLGLERVTVSRKDDEIHVPGEKYSPFYWLSVTRLKEQGYIYFYRDARGNYVFSRRDSRSY